MATESEHSLHNLPLSDRRLINDICVEYEQMWRDGQRPQLGAFADRLSGPARSLLLVELIAQELDLRAADGQLIGREDFQRRCPGCEIEVEAAFELVNSRKDSGFLDDSTLERGAMSSGSLKPRESLEVEPGTDRHRQFAEIVARTMRDVQEGRRYEFEQLAGQYPEHVEELRLLHPSIQLLADLSSDTSGREIASGVSGTLGDFRLGNEIGRGGMGIVYEARQISLDKRVAVKVLPFASVLDSRRLQRFLNEARAAAQLQHENIVPVYAVGCDRGVHYYAMRLIEGKNLAEVIRDLRHLAEADGVKRPSTAEARQDETMNFDMNAPADSTNRSLGTGADETSHQVLAQLSTRRSANDPDYFRSLAGLGIQAAIALQHAHDMGVVHRDIKPSNLMLDIEGQLWITDFGLAQVQDATEVTVTGDFVGTLRYMSPEQALAKRVVVDHRTDIYSLGVTLYELVTTQRAFDGRTRAEVLRKIAFASPIPPRKINRHIPIELETIILKALSRNPDDRYQSAQELANDLTALQNYRPIRAKPPNAVQRVEKWMRRNPAYARVIGVGAIMVLLITTLAALAGWGEFAIEQRRRTRLQRALQRSEGSRLTAHSRLELENDPGLALQLAIEGATRFQSRAANNALLSALNDSYEFRTLYGHTSYVGRARYSPSGQYIVSTANYPGVTQGAQPARIWDAHDGKLLRTLDDGTWITSAVISPDGVRVLTTTNPYSPTHRLHHGGDPRGERPPSIWDALTGRKVLTLKDARLPEAHDTCFSPDGLRLVTPAAGNGACIWDALSGNPLHILQGHQGPVLVAAFSSDGRQVATVGKDQTIRIWQAETGNAVTSFTWPAETEEPPWSISFSPDSRRLLTSFSGWGPQVWDIKSGRRVNPGRWDAGHAIFSSEGERTISYHRGDNVGEVNDIVTGRQLAALRGHIENIQAIDLSPDGQTIATASTDNTVRLWDIDTGLQISVLRGHSRNVSSVHFRPDGRQLVTASHDQTVRIWNVKSVAKSLSLTNDGAESPNSRAAYGPQGKRILALTTITPESTVWNVGTGERVARMGGMCEDPAYRPDVKVAAWGQSARIWDPLTGKVLATLERNNGRFRHARLSENGEVALVFGRLGPSYLWHWKPDRRMLLNGQQGEVYSAAVSPDGKWAATGSSDGRVIIWNADEGTQQAELLHRGGIFQTRFNSDGSQLLTVTDRNTARVWDVAAGREMVTMSEPGVDMFDGHWNADNTRVVTYHAYRNSAIALWDTSTGELVRKLTDVPGRVRIAMEPGGDRIAVASLIKGLILWDTESGEEELISPLPFRSVAISSDGQRMAAATSVPRLDVGPEERDHFQDKPLHPPTLFVWDLATREVEQTIPLPGSDTFMLRFLKTGSHVIAASNRSGASIFSAKTGEEQARILGHAAPITCAEFGPDGRRVLTTSADGTASLWDVRSGQRIHELKGHQQAVLAGAFAEDSVITASVDGKCIVWNSQTGKQTATLKGHTDEVRYLTVSKDQDRVVTLSRDHTMRLWSLDGRELDRKELAERVFLQSQFQPQGKGLLVIPGLLSPERYRVDRSVEQAGFNVRVYQDLADDQFGDTFVALPHQHMPITGSFSPNGKRVVTVDVEGDAFLWNAVTGEQLRRMHRDDQQIRMAVFDPSGTRLLTSNGYYFSLRDSRTCNELMTLREPHALTTGPLNDERVAQLFQPFSPDGKWLVTVALRGHVRQWPVNPLDIADQYTPRDLTPDEIAHFEIVELE